MTRKIASAFILAGLVAIAGHVATSRDTICRIRVVDMRGDAFVIGQGTSLADAWQHADKSELPWREITFPGCYVAP